jgi:hypothetical protein
MKSIAPPDYRRMAEKHVNDPRSVADWSADWAEHGCTSLDFTNALRAVLGLRPILTGSNGKRDEE